MSRATDKVGRSREREQVSRSTRRAMDQAETAVDQEARDIANDARSRSDAHELLCTERWNAQGATMIRVEKNIEEIKDAVNDRIGKLPAGLIAGLTGLAGYLAARAFPVH